MREVVSSFRFCLEIKQLKMGRDISLNFFLKYTMLLFIFLDVSFPLNDLLSKTKTGFFWYTVIKK